jgi:Adenylate kinase and related kinases
VNILIFGPNGSGKGTQGDLIKQKYNLAHIESGAIFREHIGGGTELGKKPRLTLIAATSCPMTSPFPWCWKP